VTLFISISGICCQWMFIFLHRF